MAKYKSSATEERVMPMKKRGGNDYGSGGFRDMRGGGAHKSYRDVVLQNFNAKNKYEIRRIGECKKIEEAKNGAEEDKFFKTIVIYGNADRKFVKELEMSIMGETLVPIDIAVLEIELKRSFLSIIEVRAIGELKTLITFTQTKEVVLIIKDKSNSFHKYFEEVRTWLNEEVCRTRRTWVKCFGLPLQAWSTDNLRRIGEQ